MPRSAARPIERSSRSVTGSGCASARRAVCALTTSTSNAVYWVVRGGKFGKSRLVPHGPRIGELLDEQLERRRRAGALEDQAPLFTFDGWRAVYPKCASRAFHELVLTLDLPVPAGVSPPRLHCLRHSFAVGCLLRWYRDGIDPSARLHQLSTFMGHVDPSSTQVYLTITPALLEEANRRFEAFAAPAWMETAR